MNHQGKDPVHQGAGKLNRPAAEGVCQSNLRSAREQVVFFYLLIVFILVSVYLDRANTLPKETDSISINLDWKSKSGESVDLSDPPPGKVDLIKDISDYSFIGKSLCLKSIDTEFDVYADGLRIYSYHPTIPKRLGMSYGMYVHTIAIPDHTAALGLQLKPVFPNNCAVLNDVVLEGGGQYMTDLFRDKLMAFGCSSVILLIGLFFLVVGVFGKCLKCVPGRVSFT